MHTNKQKGFGIIELLIIIAVIALLGVGGWYVWQAWQKNNQTPTNTQSQQTTATQSVFKIPELGVEFTPKSNVTPLYKISDTTTNGVSYKLIKLSTQQLVDKGASGGGTNPCAFAGPRGEVGYSLMYVSVYSSPSEALAVEKETGNSRLQTTDITTENGYLNLGGKIFAVPQGIQRSGGFCSPSSPQFDQQQWSLLKDSLMTLHLAQ